MIDLVKFDLINRLKKPITWFIIMVLCILIGANFIEIQKERTTRPFVGHNTLGISTNPLNLAEMILTDKEKEAYPVVYESLIQEHQIVLDIVKAVANNDYRETTRLIALWNLFIIKLDRLSADPTSDVIVKNEIYDLWLDIAGGIPYESIDFRPIFGDGKTDTAPYLLKAEYYHNLYMNDWEPIYNDEVNNLNAIYSYFFNMLPILIFLVIVLFSYNNINKDKNNGSLKLVLTQSISRGKYYFSKWVSSVLHILTVIFIPPIIMSIAGGLVGGFTTLKYPVFYLNNIFTRLVPIPNFFDIVHKDFIPPELYARVFGHIAPGFYSRHADPHGDIDIIPFYKYIILVSILVILFVMFLVAFVQLISAIMNHEIIGLVTSIGFIAIFIYIGQPFIQERAYNVNPFTFSNVSRIVEGTHNVTFLTSIIIMLMSIAILLTVGYKYFKKKEI